MSKIIEKRGRPFSGLRTHRETRSGKLPRFIALKYAAYNWFVEPDGLRSGLLRRREAKYDADHAARERRREQVRREKEAIFPAFCAVPESRRYEALD